MRRRVGLIILVAFLLSLAACGKEENQIEPQDESTQRAIAKKAKSDTEELEQRVNILIDDLLKEKDSIQNGKTDPKDDDTDPLDDTDPKGNNQKDEEHIYTQTMEERICGCYQMSGGVDEEGYDRFINISTLHGLILIENHLFYEGSLCQFWAQEIWLDDISELDSKDIHSIRGFNRVFSGQYTEGEYWDGSMDIVLTPTDSGIILADTEGDYSYEKQYERVEDKGYFHPTVEEIKDVYSIDEVGQSFELIGQYAYHIDGCEALLSFEQDGQFTYTLKEEGVPVIVLCGAWAADTEGVITVFAERIGYGNMPFFHILTYEKEGDGITISSGDDMFSVEADAMMHFAKVASDWTFSG